jgi:tetratricopeptide (TPR) repeat protein
MAREEFLQAVKSNWIAVVLFGVFLALGIGGLVSKGNTPSESGPERRVIDEAGTDAAEVVEPVSKRADPLEEARKTIEEHQAKLDARPASPDAPAYLWAMGNLYRQKFVDYNEAARCYSLLVHDYPDWEGIAPVYIALVTCYERLGRIDDRKFILEKMMERFPSDSQEYLFAKTELSPTGELAVPSEPAVEESVPEESVPDETAPVEEPATPEQTQPS